MPKNINDTQNSQKDDNIRATAQRPNSLKPLRSRKLLLWAAVLVWMAVIFAFSAQDAERSSAISGGVIRKTAEIVVPDFREMQPAEQEKTVADWQHTVRKTAHFTCYLILGVFSMTALAFKEKLTVICAFKSIAICLAYAMMDEFHQLFVAGRSGQFSDVGLDFAGALTGILIMAVIKSFALRASR